MMYIDVQLSGVQRHSPNLSGSRLNAVGRSGTINESSAQTWPKRCHALAYIVPAGLYLLIATSQLVKIHPQLKKAPC
jgi:hypothetical protein